MTTIHQPGAVVYFKNLNTIRFIAAFLVIIHHTEALKTRFPIPNQWDNRTILMIGRLGVILFFVLSGFLISYLLFKENELTERINIKHFYIRRILRIWPLYYLIIFATFFIIPFIDLFAISGFEKEVVWEALPYKLCLYMLVLPNVALSVFGLVSYASQTWSIGAEEQFYLIWPLLIKYFHNKWLLILGVILVYLSGKIILHFLPTTTYLYVLKSYWVSTPIDCMAIGGLFALLIYERKPVVLALRKIVFSPVSQIIALLLILFPILKGYEFPYFNDELFALLFGILIINFSCNEFRIFSLENPLLNYLGKISYGLYMFHSMAIVLSIKLLQNLGKVNDLMLYPLIFSVTVLMSALCYEFFEKRFIEKKVNYSAIISGDNTAEENKGYRGVIPNT